MSVLRWLLYGAYGTTGRMIVHEAIRRGHHPALAGRNERKLEKLAGPHALRCDTFTLQDSRKTVSRIQDYDLVINAAGPYAQTSQHFIDACCEAGTDYIDLCGELPVLRETFAMSERVELGGIRVLPGLGFDVAATDFLAAELCTTIPDPKRLELALDSNTPKSSGTIKAAMAVIAEGGFIRKSGELVEEQLGTSGPNIRFHAGERKTIVAPLPDLETAWHTTGIPDITTYLALPPGMGVARRFASLAGKAVRQSPVRRLVNAAIELGSDIAAMPGGTMASIWGKVSNDAGEHCEHWLCTPEPYQFTAMAVVKAVEQWSPSIPPGVHTPTQALGSDFVRNIPDVRLDRRLPV